MEIDDLVDQLEDSTNELYFQYYIAEAYFYQLQDDTWSDRYDEMCIVSDEVEKTYYVTLYHIFNSKLKEIFFEDEDLEELESLLAPYANEQLSSLLAEESTLSNQAYYEDYEDDSKFLSDVTKLIELRNSIAKIKGYDTYYEYGYQGIYKREYSIENIESYRSYVKNVISPLLISVSSAFYKFSSSYSSKYYYYYYDPCFTNPDQLLFMSDYFKTIKNEELDIDLYESVNNIFKEGRFFLGSENGVDAGFTQMTETDGSFVYFANSDYYASMNTFSHEMGHYLFDNGEDVPNADMDLSETHSQSDEALFLNYILNHATLSTNEKKYLELNYFFDNLYTVVENCMIDEFEEALYHDYSDLATKFKDGIKTSEYDALIDAIQDEYDINVSMENWGYYFATCSTYEISYGISVIPCITLYIDSVTDLDQAKTSYYKVLRYYLDENFDEETNGDYLSVLAYAGYDSPFDSATYTKINSYCKKLISSIS